MAVIGGDEDQRVVDRGHLGRDFHRVGEFDRLGQCAIRIAVVMAVVDATAFDHQKKAFRIFRQNRQRGARHAGKTRLAGRIARTFGFVAHVLGLEQSEQVLRMRSVDRVELLFVPNV